MPDHDENQPLLLWMAMKNHYQNNPPLLQQTSPLPHLVQPYQHRTLPAFVFQTAIHHVSAC